MNKRWGYRSAFYAHALISVPTLLIMQRFRPKSQPKEQPRFKEGLGILLRNQDALMFFLMGRWS
jgi:predicted MFS family arabinose efflux permease